MSEKMIRTCASCRAKKKQNELLRIVLTKEGSIVLDKAQAIDGRGAYLCNATECITKCIKKRSLNRAFKKDAGKEIYETLSKIINNN